MIMSDTLFAALDSAAAALRSVTASSLGPDTLHNAVSTLEAIPVNDLIDGFMESLPAPQDDHKLEEERKKKLDGIADELNKKLDAVNDELKRIKSMRSTLNLEALDPVIHAAQKVVRPLFNLSADLRG
jgi:hypothetical protein